MILATPYFATEHTLSNMNLDPSLRKNVSVRYYNAGHMMYIDVAELKKLKSDIKTFIDSAKK